MYVYKCVITSKKCIIYNIILLLLFEVICGPCLHRKGTSIIVTLFFILSLLDDFSTWRGTSLNRCYSIFFLSFSFFLPLCR